MSDVPSTDLAVLRTRAIDLVRAEDWPSLLALTPQLELDRDYWVQLWGPTVAVAAARTGRGDGLELLDRLLDAGFHEAEMLELVESTFGDRPDWPALRARMLANRPAPPVMLQEWPCATTTGPLALFRLPQADEQRLATRLPAPAPSAWATAEQTLAWVTALWRHTGTRHAEPDAHVILDLVAGGERFACKEFTVLLTQSLNALGIPARRVGLFRPGYHAGIGTGHEVTEAWIDDLGRWVLLDGQNGAIWRDEDGAPLGLLDLQARHRSGQRPAFTGSGPNFDEATAAEWFGYFATATVTGLAWSSSTFVPVYEQQHSVITADRLLRDDAGVSPDLARASTSVVDHDGPALTFSTEHPFACGVTVTHEDNRTTELELERAYPLRAPAGEHRCAVAVRTRYGLLQPSPLVWVTT